MSSKRSGQLKIVVLSPHCDDAAFSLSLCIYEWLMAGHLVEVMNCFTFSEYAPITVRAQAESRYVCIIEQRFLEDRDWAKFMGSGISLINLGLTDAPLRLGCTPDEVCEIAPTKDDSIQSAIETAIQNTAADGVLIPLGLGNHVDHRTARDAFVASTSCGIPFAMYEDLPYAARPGVAEAIEPKVSSIRDELTPIVRCPVPIDEAISFKRRCASFYSSQVDADVVEQIAKYCTRYEGGERIWATPSWYRLLSPNLSPRGIWLTHD